MDSRADTQGSLTQELARWMKRHAWYIHARDSCRDMAGSTNKIICLFGRILSLLQGSFAKDTYNLIEPSNQIEITFMQDSCGDTQNTLTKDHARCIAARTHARWMKGHRIILWCKIDAGTCAMHWREDTQDRLTRGHARYVKRNATNIESTVQARKIEGADLSVEFWKAYQ